MLPESEDVQAKEAIEKAAAADRDHSTNQIRCRINALRSPRVFRTASIAVIAVVLCWACCNFATLARLSYSSSNETTNRSTSDMSKPRTVTSLGRLEPMGSLIKVNAPSSTSQCVILQLKVEEGDRVKRGQVLAVLDSEKRLLANVKEALGRLQVARTRLAVTRAGAKTGEIEAQRFEIERLRADTDTKLASQRAVIARFVSALRQSETDFKRYQLLVTQGAVSSSDFEQRKLSLETAMQQVNEAQSILQQIETTGRAAIASAQATLHRIAEVRAVDVQQSEAEKMQAEAAVAQEEASLQEAYILSPLDGVVLKIYARPGEKVGAEGFADAGTVQEMCAVAEVYQSDISKVKPGQHARVTAEAAPDHVLNGLVARIGGEVRRQDVINSDPSSNIDDRVVEVRIRLDQRSSEAVARLSNCQVTAVIEL